MANLDANKARLAQLADPRSIGMNDETADRIAAQTAPVYYITGTIHSPETGAPAALMELAYRLAVDESPYIRNIRDNLITLITPIVEVDGRDKMVDLFRWHMPRAASSAAITLPPPPEPTMHASQSNDDSLSIWVSTSGDEIDCGLLDGV